VTRAAVEIPLQRRPLGSRGPDVSVIGLGGWEAGGGRTWGANDSNRDVVRALQHGFELGINWIDTAEVYAQGRSEEIVGRALRGHDDVLVFTKVAPRPDGTGVRSGQCLRALEASLRRLGREAVDVYQVHWPSPEVPIETTWEAMAALAERGLARHVGLSNVGPENLRRCARIRHVDSVQIQGSLLFTSELTRMLPACAALGTGVVCYGPLAFGLLAGELAASRPSDWRAGRFGMEDFFVSENHARFFSPAALPMQLQRVEALCGVAAELGITPAQAALSWLVSQSGVTAAIVGSRSAAHITENARAGRLSLAPRQLASIASAVTAACRGGAR
jgi:aryl-alcohol dehydrogenase-like predicted oxidoreductase